MDYRTELMSMINRFNTEAVEEFKEAEMRIARDSRFSRIRAKKDYDGHARMLRNVKSRAISLEPKAVQIPESDEEAQSLRKAFEKCIVKFCAVCDNYVQMQLALKSKSEGADLSYRQYKEINNKVKKSRVDLNSLMHEMDILYSDFIEYSKMDNSEDLAGVEYKTYDQL